MTNARRGCFVLVAGLLLAASLSATPGEIALPDGKVIHKTDNRVIGERVLPAAGSYKIHRWEEQLPSGELRSFYAYSRTTKDGSELVGRVRATTHVVRLLDFQFDPLVDGPPSFDVPLKAAQNNLHLVQLEATPLPEMTQAIADTGAKILRFLADHTFLVKADAETLVRVQSLALSTASAYWRSESSPASSSGVRVMTGASSLISSSAPSGTWSVAGRSSESRITTRAASPPRSARRMPIS
jgi:hypothetical protein